MALSLGIHQGMKIQIGPDFVTTIVEIARGSAIRVTGQNQKEFLITDKQRTEVFPEVYMSYGSPTADLHDFRGTRLAIDAPRSMKITRITNERV
jgi:hypothetical protein